MDNQNKRLSPKFWSDLSDEQKQFIIRFQNAPIKIQHFVDMYLTAPRYLQDALQITIDTIHAHEFTEHEREIMRKYRAITQDKRDTWDKVLNLWYEDKLQKEHSCKVYKFKKPPERENVGGKD